jgi:putative ABC transport system permease protein
MWKITRRDIWAHKFRFLLTILAVVLGVAFVVGTFILRDGLKEVFDELVGDINSEIDAEVRGAVEFDESDFAATPPIPDSLLPVVREVPSVAEAAPVVQDVGIVPLDAQDEAIETLGPPVVSANWTDSPLSPATLEEGRPPGPGEFLVDFDTLADEDYVIGETYGMIGAEGREEFTLVGTVRFGENNDLVGAKLLVFDLADVQRLAGKVGELDSIAVAGQSGTDVTTLVDDLNAVVADQGAEAVSRETVIDEDRSDFTFFVDIMSNALLAFALIALFVAAFLINNIFTITVGQRVRELGLLRAVGAKARQVRWSVLAQSFLIGLLATIVGIGAGALIALAIRAILDAVGFGLPSFDITIAPVTIIVAAIVGIGVTMAAAISPARRASKVPPVVAMRADYRLGEGEGRRRTIIGAIFLVVGVFLLLTGLFGDPPNGLALAFNLGVGAICIFIGVTLLSPLFAGPLARAIGMVVTGASRLFHRGRSGPSARLARENAARNTRTSAATAGALMIGLALVTTAGVFGESLKQTLSDILDDSVEADFFITDDTGFGEPFPSQLAADLEAAPEIGAVSGFRSGNVRIDGDEKTLAAVALDQFGQLVDIDVQEGELSSAPNGIAIHDDPAEDLDLGIGDTLTAEFPSGESADLTVIAIFSDTTVTGTNWLIDMSLWDEHYSSDEDLLVAAAAAEGVEPGAARAAVDEIAAGFPQVKVEDRQEFQQSQESQVDALINVINALLGLALVIAVLGIAITMALAVFERTREIGLLRAVGMKRGQAAWMVLGESVIVSIFGALLGIALGMLFGYAAVTAVPESVVNAFAVPWGSLVTYVIAAAIAGVAAGLYPAWRAGRLNVLDAIAHA